MGVAYNATQNALNIANDNSHGYDQNNRWGPNYDCSSLVITAYKKAGVPLTCTYTGNMLGDMLAHGFKNVTHLVNLATGGGLEVGDVLLNVLHHTAMYIGNGMIVHASGNEFGSATGGKSGDQTGGEICTRSYWNFPWNYVLRCNESEASVPTSNPVKPTQKPVENIQNGTYVVKQGDTLWGIAEQFYGSGTEYTRIMKDNGLTSSALWIGQTLKIGEQPTTTSSPEEKEATDEQTCTVHLPIIKYGDNGMRVRKIQSLLAACGYSLAIDGDFGTETKNTIIYLQRANGLSETGIVDSKTYEAIMS